MNYQQTILAIKHYVDQMGLPIRSWLADSWWYYKGKGEGVSQWIARPDIFPNGMAYVANATQWDMVAHNRYWAPDTVYAQQNGGNYSFAVEETMAVPIETRFWKDLLESSRQWGMTVYEQDWLNVQMQGMNYLLQSVDTAQTWLVQMGQAAKANGVPMQWCMSYPRHILQSLQVDYVTQARVSNDYRPSLGRENWDIGVSSMFTSALGIAPLKDNFWSSNVSQGTTRYDSDHEVAPKLHAVIATYSTGTVSPSDRMQHLNVDLLMRSCRQDGRLLQPDLPAVATDTTILEAAGILATAATTTQRRQVWSTMTQLSGYTYTYLLAIESPAFQLTERDLYPSNNANQGYIAWQLDSDFVPESLPLTVPESKETNIHVYAVAPILSNGYAFLGEAVTKWTPVSQSRFSMFILTKTGFTVQVEGKPDEVVELVIRKPSKEFAGVECRLPSSGSSMFSSQYMSCSRQV
jgi:hypothetical protein